jgi:transposase
MEHPPEPFPDDPERLKALLVDHQQTLSEKDDALARSTHEIEILKSKLAWFEEQLRLARHKRFGALSEKHAFQAQLFNEVEVLSDQAETEEHEDITYRRAKAKPGRRALPAHLPREEVIHDLADSEKRCGCGQPLHCIGEERTEKLDIIPATARVIVHVRPKYACRRCEDGVQRAPLPPQPIPKSIVTAGLLAWIVTGKYLDRMPLYHLEGVLKRLGVEVSRTTLASWMIRGAELLNPLYCAMHRALLERDIVQADETTVQVLKEAGKSPQSKSYLWVYRAGTGPPITLYEYQPTRGGEHPERFLDGFSGYLQSDGYKAYQSLCAKNPELIALGCMAHVRRKFDEAAKAHPNAKANKGSAATRALAMIGKLYAVERRIRDLPPEGRYRVRREKAKPLLDEFHAWLKRTAPRVMPKSLLGEAVSYALNQWPTLTIYLEDGRLEIDNNATERDIRPFVMGRKAWLFSDTPQGARASAMLYSIVCSAKANGLEPYSYLRELFEKLPAIASGDTDAIEALLPWQVAGRQTQATDSKNPETAAA